MANRLEIAEADLQHGEPRVLNRGNGLAFAEGRSPIRYQVRDVQLSAESLFVKQIHLLFQRERP